MVCLLLRVLFEVFSVFYAAILIRRRRLIGKFLLQRKCLFRDEYAKEFMNMYSYSACLVKCRIQSVQSLCKCTPYFFPSGVPTSTPVCTLKNLKCLDKYKRACWYLYLLVQDLGEKEKFNSTIDVCRYEVHRDWKDHGDNAFQIVLTEDGQ